MIDKIYAVLVVAPNEDETLFAMTTDVFSDLDGPREMQCATANPKIAKAMFEFAKEASSSKKFRLGEFVRAN